MKQETIHIGSVRVDIFEDSKWNEIPKEINQAFLRQRVDNPDLKWKSVLLCKVLPYENCVTNDGFVVIDTSSDVPDVVRLGLFWDFENAKTFALQYARKKNDPSYMVSY